MNKIKNQKILITGGAGFIGHNLAIFLKTMGADVHILDSLQVNNLTSIIGNEDNLPNPSLSFNVIQERLNLIKTNNIPLIIQDARDYHMLSKCVTRIKPDVVIHLAAVSHANRSNKDPYSTFDHSLRTLENALDASKNNIKHFIYFSSSMVYGNFSSGQVDENSPCSPLGIYGALKYSGEKMVIAYNQVFDLPYTIIRPSALYGERCISRRVGQIFIENAIYDLPININGDGSDRLDFTYIDDLIDGVVKIIENENSKNEIFNITYGQSEPILELVKILEEYYPKLNVIETPKDNLTPTRGTLSIEKAREILGYKSNWPLSKGYRKYIEWYNNFTKK